MLQINSYFDSTTVIRILMDLFLTAGLLASELRTVLSSAALSGPNRIRQIHQSRII